MVVLLFLALFGFFVGCATGSEKHTIMFAILAAICLVVALELAIPVLHQ